MNKKVLAAFGGLAAFGILTASAASLGGLTSKSLGADNTVVASCDSDGMQLSYTNTYNSGSTSYVTTAVLATQVNSGCNGKAYQLTLSNAAGTSIGTSSGSVAWSNNSFSMTVTPNNVNAGLIVSAALVITG